MGTGRMFEKPRLGTFSRFLAPSIDNSQACTQLRGSNFICSLSFLLPLPLKSSLFFASPLSLSLFVFVTLTSSSHLSFRYTCRRVVVARTSVHNTEMYRERKLTITGPPRAFIAHLGGVHTTAILLATIKY